MTNNGLEINKFAAAVLIAGLVAMAVGKISDALYHPEEVATRGFEVEVEDNNTLTAERDLVGVRDRDAPDALALVEELQPGEGAVLALAFSPLSIGIIRLPYKLQ